MVSLPLHRVGQIVDSVWRRAAKPRLSEQHLFSSGVQETVVEKFAWDRISGASNLTAHRGPVLGRFRNASDAILDAAIRGILTKRQGQYMEISGQVALSPAARLRASTARRAKPWVCGQGLAYMGSEKE